MIQASFGVKGLGALRTALVPLPIVVHHITVAQEGCVTGYLHVTHPTLEIPMDIVHLFFL